MSRDNAVAALRTVATRTGSPLFVKGELGARARNAIAPVRRVSGGTLDWSSSMLYPVLHRLEKDGLIRSQWKPSGEGRMRKYYALTEAGREELSAEKEQWFSVHDALKKFWALVETPGISE